MEIAFSADLSAQDRLQWFCSVFWLFLWISN